MNLLYTHYLLKPILYFVDDFIRLCFIHIYKPQSRLKDIVCIVDIFIYVYLISIFTFIFLENFKLKYITASTLITLIKHDEHFKNF